MVEPVHGPVHGAVVLAGGAGRRLGGVDKAALVIGGRALLDTVLDACGDAELVVVGPPRPTARPVRWTLEDPPGGGPLAGLAAGVAVLSDAVSTVAVLAVDLPSVTPQTVTRLRHALVSGVDDAVLLTDAGGHPQPLLAVYRAPVLREALRAVGEPRDQPMKALLARLRMSTLPGAQAAKDIDTAEDLRQISSN
ncbi:molybdenum cofactor guanylyltransferase [Phytoactinopolyspora alkaliphila]|uniref:molybdenum cofactor guanylyltransferase n=1 Tax=Phytoactinopolyspora alkaliphila TaxID=1783498 RepID=UPI001C20523C|nr:NTP transferase domain-containing protein [Phytoactinopolyspora alkaliphila]